MAQNFEGYKTKLYQIAFGLAFMLLTCFMFRSLMFGTRSRMILLATAAVMIGALLWLDRYYWTLGVALVFSPWKIPGMPFDGTEMCTILVFGLFAMRCMIRRERTHPRGVRNAFAALPFLFWIVMVWIRNPTGMYIFGSTMIGGRFYLKIMLATLFMLAGSQMIIGERESRVLYWTIVCAVWTILVPGMRNGLHFGGGLHYQYMSFNYLVGLMLCRYPLEYILTHAKQFFLCSSAFLLTIYSGHRTSTARPLMFALLVPFMLKRERMLSMTMAIFGFMVLLVVCAGHGTAYRLPVSIEKSLSWVPTLETVRFDNYGLHDEFRAELRKRAFDVVRNHPWLGRGGFAYDLSEVSWMHAGAPSSEYDGHALVGNWHNVWLGISADFGVPCSVMFAAFWCWAIIFGYRNLRIFKPNTWAQTTYLFCFLMVLTTFANTFFDGGHSAITPQRVFIWFGLMLAVYNGRIAEIGEEGRCNAIPSV